MHATQLSGHLRHHGNGFRGFYRPDGVNGNRHGRALNLGDANQYGALRAATTHPFLGLFVSDEYGEQNENGDKANKKECSLGLEE
jgi:hypothetical protein